MCRFNVKNRFYVTEMIATTNLNDEYIILNENKKNIANVYEKNSTVTQFAKLFLTKHLLPVIFEIKTPSGDKIIEIIKEKAFELNTTFKIKNHLTELIHIVRLKKHIISSTIEILTPDNKLWAKADVGITKKNFTLKKTNGKLIAEIKHKSESLLKELLTTADSFEIQLHNNCSYNEKLAVLATTIIIDYLFHED